jgi:predicted CXXCH cytochrome family protein
VRAPGHAALHVGLVGAAALAVAAGLALRVDARRQRAEQIAAIDAAVPSAPREGFVGSGACKACHPGAYATWHGSFHRTMTQRAEPGAVIGAFDGEPLADGTTPVRERDAFAFVTGDGAREPAVMTTGSHHMQVYWTPADDGSLVATRWAWLKDTDGDGGRWVPNAATLVRPPGDDPVFTWNRVCIKCHAVAGSPGWDEADREVRSEVAELGIACEACHGPAAAHASAHRNPLVRYARHLSAEDARDPWIVQPGRLSPADASETCAQCHSITVFADEHGWLAGGRAHPLAEPASHPPLDSWARLVRHPLHEDQPWIDPVLDEEPELFEQLYWSDGMVRVSGREYGGMIESACFRSGELSCLSCHQMHGASPDDQLRPARTDEACEGCHPAIAAAGVAHSHHAKESAGCVDCHMPHTTWGLLKAIRSHEIDVPRASVAMETGRPLACDLCHLDRSAAFTADALARWYGHDVPTGLHEDIAASAIGLLSGDAGQRALWAWHFGFGPSRATGGHAWAVPILARLLEDPVPAVRLVAARSLGVLEPQRPDPLVDGASAHAEIARSLPPPDRTGPLVLRRPDGSPDAVRIEAWARRRDDRRVLLAE